MPTSSESRKPEGQGTCGPQTDRTTPCGLNEMAAGGWVPSSWPSRSAGRAWWPDSGTRTPTRSGSSPSGRAGERGPGPGRSGLSTSSACEALWFLDP